MELWIRSQEKTRLIKVNNILAYSFDDGSCGIQINGECFVGEYKTKERALEVLDEIQSILNPMLIFKNCNCTKDVLDNIKEVGACMVTDNAHIEQVQTCIYEMPEK